jgi:translation initiation factor IF-3
MTMVIGPHKKKAEAQADARADKARQVAERDAERQAERAQRAANRPQQVAPKKPRKRSENLDLDM